MQEDLETYLQYNNNERTHQGRNMKGLTPSQVFLERIKQEEKGGSTAWEKPVSFVGCVSGSYDY